MSVERVILARSEVPKMVLECSARLEPERKTRNGTRRIWGRLGLFCAFRAAVLYFALPAMLPYHHNYSRPRSVYI